MADTNFYTWGGWGFVGALVAILALTATLALTWGSSYKAAIREQLEDVKDSARIKAELEGQTTAFQRYRSALGTFIARADAWFGPPWRWRAFDRSLLIAFVYPIVLLVLAWVVGMPGTLGTIELLPDQPVEQRMMAAFGLIVVSAGLSTYFKRNVPRRFAHWVKSKRFLSATKERSHWLREFADFLAVIFAGSIGFASAFAGAFASVGAFAGSFAVAVAFAGAFAVAIAVAIAGAGACAGSVAVAFAGAVAGAVTIAGALAGAAAGTFSGAVAVVVFLVLLPLANAALDTLSWGFTRLLLAKIDHSSGGNLGLAMAFTALVFDIFVATACLIGLVALTAMLLEAANVYSAWRGIAEIDWKTQIELARSYPFSKGILVTGMLATTLVPTAIHLTLGLGHAMTVWSPTAHETASLIHAKMPISAKQAVASVMLYRRLWMLPAFVVVCALGWVLFAAFSTWITPLGLFLEQVAIASAALISQP